MISRLTLLVALFTAAACGLGIGLNQASAATVVYQLTVSESASTMVFGGPSPSFRASLTPPADDPPVSGNTVYYFSIGGTNFGGQLTSLTAPYTLFLNGIPNGSLAAGQYSVVANYLSPNHGLLKSAPVTLTVQAATPTLECYSVNAASTITPGAPLTIRASGVTNGNFTATFAGPQTVTSTSEPLDANGDFTVTAPSAPGQYSVSCSFAGNADYAAATVPLNSRVITVSAAHQIGGISLYTDPAPLQSFTPTTWEVVVKGAPGLPSPTGYVSISIGTAFIRPLLTLGPGGIAIVNATSPAADSLAGIDVTYMGDTVYAASNVHLSINTAPLPGHSPSAAQSTNPTPQAASANAGSSPVAAQNSPSGVQSPLAVPAIANAVRSALPVPGHGNPAWWYAIAIAVFLIAATAAALAIRQRKMRVVVGDLDTESEPGS